MFDYCHKVDFTSSPQVLRGLTTVGPRNHNPRHYRTNREEGTEVTKRPYPTRNNIIKGHMFIYIRYYYCTNL